MAPLILCTRSEMNVVDISSSLYSDVSMLLQLQMTSVRYIQIGIS